MAHLKSMSHREFIQSSFSPLVAVMSSPSVDQMCKKNNLSFTELVQPFCKLTSEVNLRDPSGTAISLKNFRINICDVNSRPPQPTMARKFLNESVSSNTNERTTQVEVGGLNLDVPVSVPWFEAWRDTFLQVQFPSDHEFTKHYLACMVVVSSAEPKPLDVLKQMISKLSQMQTIHPAKLPKWFSSSVLQYHVLVHDNTEGDLPLAESLFETMKTEYGINNVFFLPINSQTAQPSDTHLPDPWSQFLSRQIKSQDGSEGDLEITRNHFEGLNIGVEAAQEAGEATSPSTPVIMHPLSPISENNIDKGSVDSVMVNSWPGGASVLGSAMPHGVCLTAEDQDRLRQLVSSFCLSCLIPHVEQQIQQLTEAISNKKGMSRSLLSATKRWFGSNKPGVPNVPQTNVTYTNDSTELQLRRLGDLCFMFGSYSLAFSAFHAAKRDFNADAAWLYYAGALEMAALSLFMQQPTDPVRKAHEYAEESILTYLNSCRMPQFATRATLFSAECLRGRGLWGEAAKQLIRMTSEDSDLRSALLLEQAAYCFLASRRPPMPRKYAFHLVLAGHRFSKAGQKKHSLRCYRQAYQIYENKDWSLAEDHIHHTIGRQAASLKLMTEAAEAFALLLPRASRQTAAQQATFLKEYLSTQQQLNSETGELPTLPLPVVDNDSIQVLLGRPPPPPPPLVGDTLAFTAASGVTFDQPADDNQRWNRMEDQLVTSAGSSLPMVFKPTVELLNNTTNNANSPTSYVGETISVSVSLNNPLHISVSLQRVRLLWSFIPASGGLCQDSGNADSTAATTHIIQQLIMVPDSSSKVILQVTPKEVGELRVTGVAYQLEGGVEGEGNVGVEGRQLLLPRGPRLKTGSTAAYGPDNRLRINIARSAPSLRVSFEGLRKDMLCGELTTVKVHFENCGNLEINRLLVACGTKDIVSLGRRRGDLMEVEMESPLSPGASMQVLMQVRAHNLKGSFTIDLLFYYENTTNQTKPLYRLVRHSWPLLVHDCLQVSVTPTRSASVLHAEETLNLRIQVHNSSQSHDSVKCEVCLECAALHSPHWQLTERGFHPAATSLRPQELLHCLVKVRRKSGSSSVSQLPLVASPSLQPVPDFLPRFCQPPSEPEDGGNGSEASYGLSLQATVIIMWRAQVDTRGGDSREAVGQHHVSLDQLGGTSWWPPPPPAATPLPAANPHPAPPPGTIAQQLVTWSITRRDGGSQKFTPQSRLCVVPVELVLRNCSDCELVVQVDATGISTSNKGYVYSPQACQSFRWVGCTQRQVNIAAHQSLRHEMGVAVGMPGAYDLSSHLIVRARRPDDFTFTQQTWRPDSILIVT